MARSRVLAFTVASVGAVLIGTVLLERLFRGSDRQWSAAVQAMLGIILTAATAIYATLTHRLLRVSEQAPGTAIHQQAAHRVLAMLAADSYRIVGIRARFPIDMSGQVPTGGPFPDDEIATVRRFADAIEPHVLQLPMDLKAQGMEAVTTLLKLQQSLVKLNTACGMETRLATADGREASWHGAKSHYYADLRDESFSLEWADLTNGEPARTADQSLEELLTAVVDIIAY